MRDNAKRQAASAAIKSAEAARELAEAEAASAASGRAEAALKVDMADPAARALVEERDAIEQRIAALKLMKPSMDEAAYGAQMEKLLTDLALKTRALRDLQARKDKP